MTNTRETPGINRPHGPEPRTVADVARGTAALAALLVSLFGVPWLLATLGGPLLPAGLVSVAEIVDTLTRPDDGNLFLLVLLLLGWAGWVAFALSVAVEIPAQLRGRSAPRLPALGASQRAAGTLVAAVAILLVNTPIPTAPTAVSRPAIVATATHHRPAQPTPTSAHQAMKSPASEGTTVLTPARGTPASHPTYRVRRHDTLWGIAERCLGAGERFTDIAALNYAIPQRDGQALTDSHWITPGWVLRLPADAHLGPDTQTTAPAPGPDAGGYTVRPGDTLWDIAETELGDGTSYRDISALNQGRPQVDGQTLRNPDHIEPGWHLRLPHEQTDGPGRRAPAGQRPAGHGHPATTTPATPAPARTPTTAISTPEPAPSPAQSPAPAGAHGPVSVTRTDDLPGTGQDSPADTVPAKVGLGLAGVTVAALLAALARRRALQQRARPLGRRIVLPDPETREVETTLRVADDRDTLAQLRAALLMLARGCVAAGRDLPALGAVRVGRAGIELLLLQDDAALVAPFAAVTADRWRADLAAIGAGDSTGEDECAFPYPALLTVDAAEDSTLLVDLEATGSLTLVASMDHARPVLNAWAVELACAPVCDAVGLTLIGAPWPAAALDAARVRLAASVSQAAPAAATRGRDVTAILHAAGVNGVREARSAGVAPDVWDPEIVLCLPGPADTTSVIGMRQPGGPGVAVVSAASSSDDAPPGWVLAPTGEGRYKLEPLGVTVAPPRLETPELAAVTAALAASDDWAGVPQPAPPEAELQVDATDDGHRHAEWTGAGSDADTDGLAGPPRVLVLGPVEVRCADEGLAHAYRRRKLTELAAYIAIHPGADNRGIDGAVWPARRVSPATRNSATSRLRRWLGTSPDGEPWLPVVPDRGQYRFRPDVRSDWDDFRTLARSGLGAGSGGLDDLAKALDLVRGRPFEGIDPACYVWAEYDIQEMISAVTDVAHALAVARLATGDPRAARTAAARGLQVEPTSELLTNDAVLAATALGDSEDAQQLVDQLRLRISALDPDSDANTGTVFSAATT